jgi:hypothetical protein
MSLALRRQADARGVELALQAVKYDVGIDIVASSPRLIAGAQTARDELSLDTAPFDARANRRFDKLGKGLAIRQHSLDLGAEVRLYANGRDGGGLHQLNVSQMRRKFRLIAATLRAGPRVCNVPEIVSSASVGD